MNQTPKTKTAMWLFISFSTALAVVFFSIYSTTVNIPPLSINKVMLSGCHTVEETNHCQLNTATPLKIWFPEAQLNDFELLINDKILDSATNSNLMIKPSIKQVKRGGVYTEIHLKNGSYTFSVESSKNARQVFNVQVYETSEWQNKYQKIEDKNDALLFLNQQLTINNKSAAKIYFYLSRLQLQQNKIDEALESLSLSNQLFEKENNINNIVDNKMLQVYILLFLQDKVFESQDILNSLPKQLLTAESNYYRYFYQANLYSYLGEYRQAQQLFQKAEDIANTFDLTKHQIDAQHMYTRILVNSGDFKQAITKREQLVSKLPSDWENCRKAKYFNGLGWAKLKMLEASTIVLPNESLPFESLNHALEMLEASCPIDSPDKINVLINLAKSYYLIKKSNQASDILLRIEQLNTQLSYRQRIELIELKGLLALSQKHNELALSYFQLLKQLAEQVKYSDFYLSALVGIADSYQQSHLYEHALKYYLLAERVVFDNSLSVPIIGSQENFLESKLHFSYRYVYLLHQLDRDKEALNVARRFHSFWLTRMFHLNQLTEGSLINNQQWSRLASQMKSLRKTIITQQSLEWSLPYDQLEASKIELLKLKQEMAKLFNESLELVNKQLVQVSPLMSEPDKNEVFLFFYPIIDGWLGFAKTQDGIHSYAININEPPQQASFLPQALAEIWLEQFKPIISQYDSIKIFPFGDMKEVNFNGLMFNNQKLIHQKTIVYGVDLKKQNNNKSTASIQKRSLIVANSLGDLKSTESEAQNIINAVQPFAWQSTLLLNNEATIKALQQQLSKVSLFHYAGHVNSPNSGIAEHELPLANSISLKTRDILLLPQAPKWVVLSACNSSGNSPAHQVESIGLAHAFVISGSEFVIATNQPVKDHIAKTFMSSFYHHWMSKNDFIQAARQTQIDLMDSQPQHNWLAFRVITI